MTKDSIYTSIYSDKINQLENLINTKTDSLKILIDQNKLSQSYFSDILTHQWTLLSIQTAIFISIVLIIISIAGYLSWKFYLSKIFERVKNIESTLYDYEVSKEKLTDMEKRIESTNMNAIRSLYEGATDPMWKVIWHIRYCYCFYKINSIDGLIFRMGKLENEFQKIQTNPDLLTKFKKFENINGVKKILKEIVQSNNSKVVTISANILSKI